MDFSGAALTVASYLKTKKMNMTATEVKQRMASHQLDAAAWAAEIEAGIVKPLLNASKDLHVKCATDMSNLVQRIADDRQKLLKWKMSPKHIYLGQRQFRELKANYRDMTFEGTMNFMGFTVYEVQTDDHYVMTGE